MKQTLLLPPDITRRTFIHRSAGALAASTGLLAHAQAEPEHTYGLQTPDLRSRAEVQAVLGKAPKPAAEAILRPLTILFAGGAKDHPPRSHSHDVLPKRWKVLLGGAGSGDEAVTNLYRPQVEADRALITSGSPQVTALSTLEWPTEEQFATADVIVLYQSPQCWKDASHLPQIEAFLNRGGGLVLSHYVLWNATPALANLLGLAKGQDSHYKHMDSKLTVLNGAAKISLSPKGITALIVDGVKVSAPFQAKFIGKPSPEKAITHKVIQTPFGEAHAMILSFGPELTWLYAYLASDAKTTKSAKLHITLPGRTEALTDDSFPFEFSLPLKPTDTSAQLTFEAQPTSGQNVKSEMIQIGQEEPQ
jgi:hypothetical protein